MYVEQIKAPSEQLGARDLMTLREYLRRSSKDELINIYLESLNVEALIQLLDEAYEYNFQMQWTPLNI